MVITGILPRFSERLKDWFFSIRTFVYHHDIERAVVIDKRDMLNQIPASRIVSKILGNTSSAERRVYLAVVQIGNRGDTRSIPVPRKIYKQLKYGFVLDIRCQYMLGDKITLTTLVNLDQERAQAPLQ